MFYMILDVDLASAQQSRHIDAMLVRRLRRWVNICPTLSDCVVATVLSHNNYIVYNYYNNLRVVKGRTCYL